MPIYMPAGIPSGTAFPSTPATGATFFRTDSGREYFWDGTNWLTTHEFSLSLPPWTTVQTSAITVDSSAYNVSPVDYGENGAWFTKVIVEPFVVTTNNGTNFWSMQAIVRNAAGTATTLGPSVNTSADANNQFVRKVITIDLQLPASQSDINIRYTKTGTPGGLFCGASAYYRLIG